MSFHLKDKVETALSVSCLRILSHIYNLIIGILRLIMQLARTEVLVSAVL